MRVIAGKDKGAEGKVISVQPENDRVIVEGVNRIKRHTKVVNQGGRAGTTGGIVTQEAAIHVSNVMLLVEAGRQERHARRLPPRRGHQAPQRRVDYPALAAPASRGSPERRSDEHQTNETQSDTDRRSRGCRRATARRSSPRCRSSSRYANVMNVPRLTKVVVNMGVGEAARDSKLIEGAVRDLTAITGQKPQVTRARKSIAQFKLREGMPIGAHVTLRGDRMWEFMDRLLSLALPRIRDFRGLSPQQFDGRGNYTFGLTEQVMFHEINQDQVDRSRGMDITVVTTATTDDEGRALLKQLGFPFREQ